MRRVAPTLLALTLLLAGCITSSTDPPAEGGADVAPAAAPERTDEAPAAPSSSSASATNGTGSSPAPAPAANGTSGEADGAASAPPAEPRTVEVTGRGAVTLKVGAPCAAPEPAPCQPAHEAEPVLLALAAKDPSRAVLAIAWTPTTKATETMSFNVTGPDGTVLGAVEGTGPLVLALPAEGLRGLGEIAVAAVAPTPGVVAGQEFDLVLTLTYGA